jgi:transcriptional regulator with XRE-family HTH domain
MSSSIRERRLQLGLTLSQLARRVRTSAATISRYESGWHRFELFTLQKLASALGCRLRVQLEPINRSVSTMASEAPTDRIQRLFWDKPLEDADFTHYPRWVIQRVLDLGSLMDVRVLIGRMGKDKFLQEVGAIRFSSDKAQAFWRMMLEFEGIKCTRESSRRAARISWRR